ncbi:baseplate assembly protein [Azotobacter chroococcum]|uniref:baseplate assembly protein n=1 Tax=Azotobacter chroococcum TaxID=353 RepID=UPI0010AECF1D|nr:baseplate J/gp47 family protein [Azotobacter chroococcum]TKD40706.1 baseplate assembly protein [Azotobacter chroococcum]
MIDLSQLPAPDVVELLDYETLYQDLAQEFTAVYPTFPALLESDPAVKMLELFAYRELRLRARINDAARGVMLAYAAGPDLDHLGARDDVERLLIDPGDSTATPPRAPVYEDDIAFRRRIQLAPEGYTTAGSQMSYVYHGLSADPDVADIEAVSPVPGVVTVYVLARSGDGSASEALLAAVTAALNQETVRPMTDQVGVQSASIVTYAIVAELVLYPGPDAAVVRAAALAAAEAYAAAQHALRRDVTLSGLYAALHQPGVQRVDLGAPSANLVIGSGEASYCTGITLTVAGATDV